MSVNRRIQFVDKFQDKMVIAQNVMMGIILIKLHVLSLLKRNYRTLSKIKTVRNSLINFPIHVNNVTLDID